MKQDFYHAPCVYLTLCEEEENKRIISEIEKQRRKKMVDFEAHFSKGQEIEVGDEDKGFLGSWYAANIVQTPRKRNKKKVLVEYQTLMDDLETSKPLKEYVDTHLVRPRPPQDERFFFEIGEAVEVYHNDGWWEGTIHQVVEKNLRYIVCFKGSGDEVEFKQSEMRSHRPWINGKWVRAQQLQTIDSSFCVGASVEVCFKDENYRDAWFPATLLKRINYSSFLVEYQSLRLQFMVGKSKETVDSLHIRPLPPDTSQDKRFDLLEKVDAFTDCGWWSGVITKILAGSKYIVFFKHRHEQKEFSHSELRFHMDWIDGKWFQNSKEILPQGRIEAPRQVKSREAGKTDQNIEMASRCEDAAKNVAMEKSPGQVQSGDAGKTDQSIDLGSRSGEDAAKNVAVDKSPGQARQQAGNQSSPSKLGSPGHRQTHQADPVIDMAITPCGNAAKTVVAKIISRKVDNQSTPDKVSSASYTINSCKKRKIQSTSESDTDCINSSKNKKIQSTSASDTNIIISNKKTQKMQSTTEIDTNIIISSKKAQKVQSTPESNTDSSQTCKKLKTSKVLKTPLSLIACHARAMATRLQTEADRQYDFATQATEGQGANIEAKNFSEHIERMSVESPILAEMFLNWSEEGYNDHLKHLNSGQELLKHVLESNDIKQQTTKEMSKQTLNVYRRRTIAKDSSTKASMKEDESFPFIKCSPAWEIIESWEVFRIMPQRLHFRPLEQFDMVLREGLAIGSMVSYANIVEKVRKSKLDDPLSILQDRSKALEDLKSHGFNVQPIQARLETMLRIKDEHAKLNDDLMKFEDQFNMKLAEKSSRGKAIDEINRKMRELQECLNQLSKKKRELTVLEKKVHNPSMAELKKTMDNVRGHIHSVTSKFRTVVATPL